MTYHGIYKVHSIHMHATKSTKSTCSAHWTHPISIFTQMILTRQPASETRIHHSIMIIMILIYMAGAVCALKSY